MDYDWNGELRVQKGKRRPNTPKSVQCHKCGKDTNKVAYGTYECDYCRLVYQYQYGKLVRGTITFHKETYRDKWGCTREKKYWSYGFPLEKGKDCDLPLI
jgi:hypothetical protein